VTDDAPAAGWLLISVSTAGAAASLRVQVWRKLRSLGALYLQQSVCLLPATEDVAREVRRLLDRVHHQGGSGQALQIELTNPAEHAHVVAQINDARDVEYAEVLERLPEFRAELEKELARGRATYVEVEECEADLDRFRSWISKIAARDYFDAPGAAAARDALEAAAAELAAFEQAALSAEAPPEEPASASSAVAGGRLRVVDES
jgi:uncharacterized protein YdbL (DUF1318 family)